MDQLRLKNQSFAYQEKGIVSNSRLILIGFASAFFPRLLDSLGAPAVINFVHFGIVPAVFLIALFTTKTRDRKRTRTVAQLVSAIFALLITLLISTVLNGAGMPNIALQFMFQAEPFLLLTAIIAVPMTGERLEKFRYWVLGFALFNLVLAIAQSILLPLGLYPKPTGGTLQDNIGGVFGGGGGSAANYVSCTVSLYFSIYFFNHFKQSPLWLRALPVLAALYQTQVSDSKQVFMGLAIGWGLLAATNVEKPLKLIAYLSVGSIAAFVFGWMLLNLDAAFLAPYQNWTNRPIWGWDGLAAQTKFAGFRIIPTHFESPLNWLFGLGPGHTVSRLGGWVMRDYRSLLMPLGATTNQASADVWEVVYTVYLPRESTVYFPLFSWMGWWGDSGIVGILIYLYLCFVVWQKVCVDDFGKFLLLSTASFGWILTQMEEPGHVLTVACLLALRWQETREKETSR
ncbi:hypothetical protein [cf. Phormidesmis sp. LEGE 11477]|uniref:hypothetical protein n=1 Tax=cf. Phormidesmis sp. LEGE 11477 TaxID=1828680 RepID=UPI001881BD47|nr:hypothetical protein [cf. Phormidesmis sp. LEGE 11477]MBE9061249.1 hypothetical protein [cf. Phormidesmis sp. LEGE 11477]